MCFGAHHPAAGPPLLRPQAVLYCWMPREGTQSGAWARNPAGVVAASGTAPQSRRRWRRSCCDLSAPFTPLQEAQLGSSATSAMAAAGALAWARRLALALPLPGTYLARLGVPDSNFCVNATYEHRLDDPATYNFCR